MLFHCDHHSAERGCVHHISINHVPLSKWLYWEHLWYCCWWLQWKAHNNARYPKQILVSKYKCTSVQSNESTFSRPSKCSWKSSRRKTRRTTRKPPSSSKSKRSWGGHLFTVKKRKKCNAWRGTFFAPTVARGQWDNARRGCVLMDGWCWGPVGTHRAPGPRPAGTAGPPDRLTKPRLHWHTKSDLRQLMT